MSATTSPRSRPTRWRAKPRKLCVHRKGATRAFPPHHPEVPEAYRETGQPVLIPGDMGRYSYVLVGTEKALTETFGSTCHGAGRLMSRHQAKKVARGRSIIQEMAAKGIVVRGAGRGTIDEEISEAYKDVGGGGGRGPRRRDRQEGGPAEAPGGH